MKVILLKDFPNLGKRSGVIDVKDGYARNFLLPQKIAIPYSKGNIKRLEMEKTAYQKKQDKEIQKIEKFTEELKDMEIVFTKKIHDEDKLYGSISEKDIYRQLVEKGMSIEKDQIVLSEHIKTTGDFTAAIKLKDGKQVDIKIKILKEAEDQEKGSE